MPILKKKSQILIKHWHALMRWFFRHTDQEEFCKSALENLLHFYDKLS